MFSVLFEVDPHLDQRESYVGYAKLLRPDLVGIDGFIDNIRYRSLRRPGRLLSLSTWRDEKALVRWRTAAVHHRVQQQGRATVFSDYHLRVGQVTEDTQVPAGHTLREQRLDETETGESKAVSLIETAPRSKMTRDDAVESLASQLGLVPEARELVAWDVFESLLPPLNLLLLSNWRSLHSADIANVERAAPDTARRRRVRVIRDYGMYDRRETPQFHKPVRRISALLDDSGREPTSEVR